MFDEAALLYAERPEWKDITPIQQYEGDANPIAPILYTAEYKDATDYFRGIVKVNEKSERVLKLTEHVIRMNPAHYTAWQYRYETIMALKSSLDDELKLMDEIAVQHLKTYQVWHHRRLLLIQLRKPAPELSFITESLKVDVKNYHTWSYRQWLLAYFNEDELWEGELDFVDQMLYADIRNNSAWHHRFFVVFQSGIRTGEEDRLRILKRELTFAKQNISLAPNNPSAWNYLRGVLDHNKVNYAAVKTFVEPYTKPTDPTATEVVDLDNPPPSKQAELPCVPAIEFLADVYESSDEKVQAKELWKSLAEQHDKIRRRYWEYRIRETTTNADISDVNKESG